MPGDRVKVTIPGETGDEELVAGVEHAYTVVIEDYDGTLRDLTTDTLSVTAKLDAASKTLTFAAKANQTTTGKGLATLTVPAGQLSGAGTLKVDLKHAKSGGNAQLVKKLEWDVVASETE